jgi:hypothetical protein
MWFWPTVFSISAVDLLITVRWGLRDVPLLPETKPRLAASACSLLIVAALLLSTPLSAAACFASYLLSDLASSRLTGPPLRAEMVAHHVLCVVLTGAGMRVMVAGSPGERAAVEACAAALLWMEAVNPLLHLLWVVSKEPEARRRTPLWARAAVAAALLGQYAWLRVAGSARVAADVWGRFWDVLGAPAPFFFALVVALATMQVVWWLKIANMVVEGVRGGGAEEAAPPSAPPPRAPAAAADADGMSSVLVKARAKQRFKKHAAR